MAIDLTGSAIAMTSDDTEPRCLAIEFWLPSKVASDWLMFWVCCKSFEQKPKCHHIVVCQSTMGGMLPLV